MVSRWTVNTGEQGRIQARLLDRGVEIHTACNLAGFDGAHAELRDVHANRPTLVPCGTVVVVGYRASRTGLYDDLVARGVKSVERIGDCLVPGAIVHAVYSGHRYARELDAAPENVESRREPSRHVELA